MKTSHHLLAIVLAGIAFNPVSPPAFGSDDTVSVSLAEALKLLEGLPDLKGKSEEEAKRIVESNPGIARRVDLAEKKVREAMAKRGTEIDLAELDAAVREMESIRELQGKSEEETARIMASDPAVRRRVASARRRLSAAAGGHAEEETEDADDAAESASAEGDLAPDDVEPIVAFDDSSTKTMDDVFFGELNWDFGGFRGQKAEKTDVRISGLKMGREGLSFDYVENLSSWGLGYDEAGALACLFVCDYDGNWVGGKFDWISSSRDTRDFENIYSGYEGWDLHNVPNPCPVVFVIVSADGGKRSNVISGIWER